jgi:hypothetical protein
MKFRNDFGRAERDAIYADAAALQVVLPGMRHIDSGRNVSPEGLGKGFDEGLIIDFDDARARDDYLVHPDHQKLGARIVAAVENGPDGIFVFDFDL